MCISVAHYLVYCHENIHPPDNVDQYYRTRAAVVDMSRYRQQINTNELQ